MSDYSLAIVVGRLTRDPELKYTNPGGIPYLKMSLAVNRQVKRPDGETRKTVSFVDVVVWRRSAEICAQFLKKGRTVMVVGSLRQSRWIAKDGTARSRIEVQADRVQFLGPRGNAGSKDDEDVESAVAAASRARESGDDRLALKIQEDLMRRREEIREEEREAEREEEEEAEREAK